MAYSALAKYRAASVSTLSISDCLPCARAPSNQLADGGQRQCKSGVKTHAWWHASMRLIGRIKVPIWEVNVRKRGFICAVASLFFEFSLIVVPSIYSVRLFSILAFLTRSWVCLADTWTSRQLSERNTNAKNNLEFRNYHSRMFLRSSWRTQMEPTWTPRKPNIQTPDRKIHPVSMRKKLQ